MTSCNCSMICAIRFQLIQEDYFMNARQELHQVHLQDWIVRFADQKSSGLTVRQWCEQNNLSFHTYNYWKHLLKEEVVDQALPDIVSVSVPALPNSDHSLEITNTEISYIRANHSFCPNRTNFKIQINDISIGIDSSASEEFLSKLTKVVCHA